jgi:hypothetical protein
MCNPSGLDNSSAYLNWQIHSEQFHKMVGLLNPWVADTEQFATTHAYLKYCCDLTRCPTHLHIIINIIQRETVTRAVWQVNYN